MKKYNLGFIIQAEDRTKFQFLVQEIEEKVLNKHQICYSENIHIIKDDFDYENELERKVERYYDSKNETYGDF